MAIDDIEFYPGSVVVAHDVIIRIGGSSDVTTQQNDVRKQIYAQLNDPDVMAKNNILGSSVDG